MTELQVVPTSDFEKFVMCNEDAMFRPTKDNMAALHNLHQRLGHQLEDTKTEITELRDKLIQFWDRLRVDDRHREAFRTQHKYHSAGTLKALKDEIKRCEKLKYQNIKCFVEELRKELKCWWDKCLIGEEERLQFLPHSSECFTADVLRLHELELRKLQSYYAQNNVIFILVNQGQELWARFLYIENQENYPKRLFQNRGAQLLFEEKERNYIQKQLPNVESG